MRQDKDRSGKWLLTHHGDAVLRLAGVTGFTAWKALQPETVAPRRLPDGLIEIRFPGQAEPTLVLVEIETYPDAEADRQVLEDLMLIAVERRVVPEVVALVLKPKGNLTVSGSAERVSMKGRTRVSGSWPVVRLWELEAEELLAAGDAGLIPWVPFARSTQTPDEVMTRCRDRLEAVPDSSDRAGLTAVTQILASLAFPGRRFWNLFGGTDPMIESPLMDEIKEIIHARAYASAYIRALRENVIDNLQTRFQSVPPEVKTALDAIGDESRIKRLHKFAVTCPDVDSFVTELTRGAADAR